MAKRYEIKCACGRHMMVGGAIACSVCYAEAREGRERARGEFTPEVNPADFIEAAPCDYVALARDAGYDGSPGGEREWCIGNGMVLAAPKVPLGFTHTEIEVRNITDSASTLCALVECAGSLADDFLDGDYAIDLVAETLTDGSIKRSVRIFPINR